MLLLCDVIDSVGWLVAPALLSLALYLCAVILLAVYHLSLRIPARHRAWADRDEREADRSLLSVSVLKPLCGHDEELERNLVSYALLDYPNFEVICRADDPFDPALAIARRVAKRFPHVRFQILAGGAKRNESPIASNPKVAQLQAMLEYVRGELVLLSDSNVRTGSMDLRALAPLFSNPKVGLVYQPFYGEGEQTLGAALENLRNCEFPGMLCIGARLFAYQEVVTAKGMLVRMNALRSIDGFAEVMSYHNDDHLLAMSIRRAGWKLRLAPIPAREIQVRRTLSETLGRHQRHAAGRWRCCLLSCLLEVIFNPVLCALPLLVCGTTGILVVFAVGLTKWTMELLAGRVLRGLGLAPRFWIVLPLKDLVMPGLLVSGIFVNRVSWRGRIYRMGKMTRLELVPDLTPRFARETQRAKMQ
jgi:ceramide glucosyltransferase